MYKGTRFFAPGRLNLIGEHTDYSGGLVMPAPLSLGIYFENVLPSSEWCLNSSSTGESFEGDPLGRWSGSKALHAFISAISITASRMDLPMVPLSGVIGSDLPAGNGLSSSTALTSVLLFAVAHHAGWDLDRHEMALLAQQVEQTMGIQCGIMDQYCMWKGYPGQAMLLDCSTLAMRPVGIALKGKVWFLVLSGVRHHLLDSPYNQRREQLFKGMEWLIGQGVDADFLKNPDDRIGELIGGIPDSVHRKRMHYVWSENRRVLDMEQALLSGDATAAAALLNEGHDGLSMEYEVSCPEIDTLVRCLRDSIPDLGIRMVGGGFGGALLALADKHIPHENWERAFAAYSEHYPTHPSMLSVELGGPVRELPG